jgi:hypothetical protein
MSIESMLLLFLSVDLKLKALVCAGCSIDWKEQSPSSGQIGITIRIAADMRQETAGNSALCTAWKELFEQGLYWRLWRRCAGQFTQLSERECAMC